MAWHIAYLTAYAPGKARKFPKLEKLLWKEPPKRQSIAEMRDVARQISERLTRRSAHHQSDAASKHKRKRDAEDDGDKPASEA